MQIILLGSTTSTGSAFQEMAKSRLNSYKINAFSRRNKGLNYIDLDDQTSWTNIKFDNHTILVSFAPIWKLSDFLEGLTVKKKKDINKIDLIIACSSSSVLSKRFAFNNFDKGLSRKLKESEEKLIDFSSENGIECKIIQPTLIYGNHKEFKDKNINKIINILRLSPLMILPKHTGLRQPIHCTEIAELTIHFINQFQSEDFSCIPERILVGGEKIINYQEMIMLIQKSLPKNDRARKCFILSIPNRIFFLLSSIIILFSPKYYEAILRTSADLSGFKTISKLTGKGYGFFPIKIE
ncbi:hypothetical protein CL656_06060 [bacterium]|nr:hypothetical protein [bacterium]